MKDEIDSEMEQGPAQETPSDSVEAGSCCCGRSAAKKSSEDDPSDPRAMASARSAQPEAAETPAEGPQGEAAPARHAEPPAPIRPMLPVRSAQSPHGVARSGALQPPSPALAATPVVSDEAPRARRPSRRVIILASAAAIVVIAAAVIGIALGGARPAPSEGGAPGGSASGSPSTIRLKRRYTTMYTGDDARYPSFTFGYPGSWSIAENSANEAGESVTLSSESGLSIVFEHRLAGSGVVNRPATKLSIERVGRASFTPGSVRETSYRELGSFIVARLEAGTGGASAVETGADTCYALVPKLALKDRGVIATSGTVPSFCYGDRISFYCLAPEKGLSRTARRQVVAILGSLTVNAVRDNRSARGPDDTSAESDQDGDYLLPDSAARQYGVDELTSLSTEKLFLARNEIYARHGRIFKNETLNSYFRKKTWYQPSVAAENFSTSVLSDIERKNIETIHQIEADRGSPHV